MQEEKINIINIIIRSIQHYWNDSCNLLLSFCLLLFIITFFKHLLLSVSTQFGIFLKTLPKFGYNLFHQNWDILLFYKISIRIKVFRRNNIFFWKSMLKNKKAFLTYKYRFSMKPHPKRVLLFTCKNFSVFHSSVNSLENLITITITQSISQKLVFFEWRKNS